MKNNIKLVVSLMGAALLAFGCNKNINPDVPQQDQLDTTPLTVSVALDPETKAVLGGDGKVNWESTDTFNALHVYGEGAADVDVMVFTVKEIKSATVATFQSESGHHTVTADSKFYAFYGCEINANKKPMWPSNQSSRTTGTLSDNNISGVPMFAMTSLTETPEPVDNVITLPGFHFKNAGGILELNVTNNTASPINPTTLTINGIKSGEFNLPTFDGEGNPSFTFTSKAKSKIEWGYEDYVGELPPTQAARVRIACPAGDYTSADGLKFTFYGTHDDIPYGYVRTLNSSATLSVHRSTIDKININLYKAVPIDVNDLEHATIGTVGNVEDMQDPHHSGPRQGIVAGFDLTSGQALTRLVIATSNVVLNGKTEDDGEEHPWNPGTLMSYNETNKHTAGGHWRLMTKDEAEKVIQTDEHGSGRAMWGKMKGLIKGVEKTTEGIYWYFDPVRYKQQYGADVLPNSIFLPVTHHDDYHDRMEGRYWLNGGYCFEFYQDPQDPTRGIVEVKLASEIQGSDRKGALRLVHTIDPVQSLAISLSVDPTEKVYMETMAETTVVANVTFSAASAENVVWSTSNSNIARVINVIRQDVSATEAKFTATIESDANNLGDVTITAKIGGLTETIDIRVVPAWNY